MSPIEAGLSYEGSQASAWKNRTAWMNDPKINVLSIDGGRARVERTDHAYRMLLIGGFPSTTTTVMSGTEGWFELSVPLGPEPVQPSIQATRVFKA